METKTDPAVEDDKKKPRKDAPRTIEDLIKVVPPKGQMDEKHKNAHPYYIFFNLIPEEPETHSHPLSVTYPELLDHSLGNLCHSLQLTYEVDIEWLIAQYSFAGYEDKPLTILYGDKPANIESINETKPNIHAYYVDTGLGFGFQHTKMSILCYDDKSIRIIISTANLHISDWSNLTQGLWMSPRCPQLADPSGVTKGESPTGFKRSLLQYLKVYSMPCLSQYIEIVKLSDLSKINVFLVASVPGGHYGADWGLSRIGWLTRKHCEIPATENDKWDFVFQASSVGSYGEKPEYWLTGDFQMNFCLSKTKSDKRSELPPLRMIYPTLFEVLESHAMKCGPYFKELHCKQAWVTQFMHSWRAEHSKRSRSIPHMKSYLRLSPDSKKAAFFLLTSSNMSKSAWGKYNARNKMLYMYSYEAGVLFLPKFVISDTFFSVELDDSCRLPVPYDLPPTPYPPKGIPYICDLLLEYLCDEEDGLTLDELKLIVKYP